MSPTVFRDGPYRVFLWSSDRSEPPHVHVNRDERTAKFWHELIALENDGGFPQNELNKIEGLVRSHQAELLKAGMTSSGLAAATARDVRVTDQSLTVELSDGRSVSVPLEWYPRLAHGRPAERRRWEIIGTGIGIHWPDLDEDISVEALLLGERSGESAESLRRWRTSRQRPANKRLQPTARPSRSATRRG